VTTPVAAEGTSGTSLAELRRRGWLGSRLRLLGPAFVAAVAYVDPGNFATNIEAGARYGYQLVWVVVMADLMAVLVQYLSAKLGLATGKNLPEICGEAYSRPARLLLWLQAEVVAMATDVAEFIGAALGLDLLFGVPLFLSGLVTAVVAFGVLSLQQRGYRPFEVAITAMLGLVAAGFGWDVAAVGHQSAVGLVDGLAPDLSGSGPLTLTIGIVGATVMPHVIYLHSALTQSRVHADTAPDRRHLLRWLRIDCGLGLGAAGVVNLLMMAVAVALLHRSGLTGVDSIRATHAQLSRLVGGGAALAFSVSLLASGLSSASVGTFAGQVVMRGMLNRQVPLFVRRAVTMVPALVLLATGVSVTHTLVASQVVLSFGIPFALVPLVVFTSRAAVMGDLVNTRSMVALAGLVAALITGLNVYLLVTAVV
jgi:manganese transport protein